MKKAAAKTPTAREDEKALRQRWRAADIVSLQVLDTSWNYDDAQVALKLQASLKRHGQFRPVLCVTPPDGSTVVVDGRRLLVAMQALGWTRCMVCDVGEAEAQDIAAMRLAVELRFETDYARLAQAVHAYITSGVTVDRLASAGPFTAERIGHLHTLATFDWSQFAEAADDGQHVMDWDAEELPQAPQPGDTLTAPGGEVFQAPEPEPVPAPVPAAVSAPPAPVTEEPAVAEAAPPAAAPAKGKPKKAAPPPGPSLFDDIDEVA